MLSKINDYYTELYAIAKNINEELKKEEVTYPFVPYSPAYTGEVSQTKSIIWYGASPNGWHEISDRIVHLKADSEETYESFRANQKQWATHSQFWRVFDRIVHDQLGDPIECLKAGRVVWNNVWKLGSQSSSTGMPPTDLRKKQVRICANLIKLEMQLFKPKTVVLHTGDLANEIINEIFDWSKAIWSEDRNCCRIYYEGVCVVWSTRSRHVKDTILVNHIADAIRAQ